MEGVRLKPFLLIRAAKFREGKQGRYAERGVLRIISKAGHYQASVKQTLRLFIERKPELFHLPAPY